MCPDSLQGLGYAPNCAPMLCNAAAALLALAEEEGEGAGGRHLEEALGMCDRALAFKQAYPKVPLSLYLCYIYNISILYLYYIYTVSILYLYCIYTISTLCLYYIYIISKLYLHCIFTMLILYLYYRYTISTLYPYYVYTISILYVHYIYAISLLLYLYHSRAECCPRNGLPFSVLLYSSTISQRPCIQSCILRRPYYFLQVLLAVVMEAHGCPS
jgi:hypothetical protein